jgi:hypothetical protein
MVLLALLWAGLAGCGSVAGSGGDGGLGLDGGQDGGGLGDLAFGNDGALDLGLEQDLEGTGDATDAVFVPELVAGAVGSNCLNDEDCDDHWCIDVGGAGMCTRACIDECPAGWVCRTIAYSNPDLVELCIPLFAGLCAPCTADADCQGISLSGQGVSSGARCVSYGEAGFFCGGDCSQTDCPAGYECTDVAGTGGTTKQCLKKNLECKCPAMAVNLGLTTECSRSNELGTCKGQRQCGEEGLTDCDAPLAVDEFCDSLDNDCDGLTDNIEPNQDCFNTNLHGSCEGIKACVEGKEKCMGPIPQPESCDGQDNDCDGSTDEHDALSCKKYYLDADGDDFGVSGEFLCACAEEGLYTATEDGDCADDQKAVNPGIAEDCDDLDNNCAGGVDEGCDDDFDGWCDQGLVVIGLPAVCDQGLGDCNDFNGELSPGAIEACDGVDNNCAGGVDEGCDDDDDDYCDSDLVLKGIPAVCPKGGGDCEDGTPAINPGSGHCVPCLAGDLEESKTGCAPCAVRSRVCSEKGFWGGWSDCVYQCSEGQKCYDGACVHCVPNVETQEDVADCGGCERKVRICDGAGKWNPWSECQSRCTGDSFCLNNKCVHCTPNDDEVSKEGCQGCHRKTRYCGPDGEWGLWGGCINQCIEGEFCQNDLCMICEPGETESIGNDCQPCERKTRTCDETGHWGNYGACTFKCNTVAGEFCWSDLCVDCIPGTLQESTAGCAACAKKTKTCSNQGRWGLFGPCLSLCPEGWLCDGGRDCYKTLNPVGSPGGPPCGAVTVGEKLVTTFCYKGDYCHLPEGAVDMKCKTNLNKAKGTIYSPYQTAGGSACGVNEVDGVPVLVACVPGDECDDLFKLCIRK